MVLSKSNLKEVSLIVSTVEVSKPNLKESKYFDGETLL